ncbi:MAG: PaaI family thioesterase [Ruminococcus sp.]|nr:PaaI family thioesterase [Oscillospiraceae bacterium]
MKTIEEVRELFSKDRYATENGAVIDEIGEHYAKCSLAVDAHHKNAMGAVMGGVSFTLADFAFAVASNWEGVPTVSLSSTINYLGKVRGERLIAEAILIKDGRTTCCYSISVTDELGNKVSEIITTGYHV